MEVRGKDTLSRQFGLISNSQGGGGKWLAAFLLWLKTMMRSCKKGSEALNSSTRIRIAFSIAVTILFSPAVFAMQSVMVGWNASTDPGIAGYALYYGTTNGNYSTRVDVGTNTSVAVSRSRCRQNKLFCRGCVQRRESGGNSFPGAYLHCSRPPQYERRRQSEFSSRARTLVCSASHHESRFLDKYLADIHGIFQHLGFVPGHSGWSISLSLLPAGFALRSRFFLCCVFLSPAGNTQNFV